MHGERKPSVRKCRTSRSRALSNGAEPGARQRAQPCAGCSAQDQLDSTDDCDFSPFSIDVKPNHGSPDYARDVAFQKITSRIQGTKMAAELLGIR